MSPPAPPPDDGGDDRDGLPLTAARAIERLFPRSLHNALPPALVIIAAGYAVVFLACATARLTFGFELSWLESGMQAMTDRIAAHQSIYAEPSPSYVPFIYPPLYYVVAQGINHALPSLGRFTPMRLLSLAATLATALTVFAALGRRPSLGQRRRLLLAALFLAFYGRFEFWHDTSRVDSLFVGLLFAAIALLIEGRGAVTAIAAGSLGGMAIITKQPALPLLIATAGMVVVTERSLRRAAIALAAAAATTVGSLAALGELFNPWLYYYVLRVPTTHAMLPHTLAFSVVFTLGVMPLFVLFAAIELRRPARRNSSFRATSRQTDRCWALTFAVWTGIIFVLRLKQGASINFFLPLVPVGIIVAGAAFERLGARGEPLLLIQFLILIYNPLAAIPTAADWRAGFELLGDLRRIPGPIFLPQFPAYLSMLGKPPVAEGIAVCDLTVLRPDLMQSIREQIDQGHYSAAAPWAAEAPAGQAAERCRPQLFARPSHPFASIPRGGEFFALGHRSKLGEIDVFDAPTADGPGRR